MTILHQLKDHNALMPIGDLIAGEEIYSIARDKCESLWNHCSSDILIQSTALEMIQEANQALRQPLEISDFVQPDKPSEKDYHTGQLGYGEAQNNWIRALREWNNWKPLFEGWSLIDNDENLTAIMKDDFPITFWHDASVSFSTEMSYKLTREDFLKACKEHNVEI